jgi:hypothetical protein
MKVTIIIDNDKQWKFQYTEVENIDLVFEENLTLPVDEFQNHEGKLTTLKIYGGTISQEKT